MMCPKRIQTTVSVDDELYERARQLTGIERLSTLFEEGLRTLIQRESARRSVAGGRAGHELSKEQRRRRLERSGDQ